MIQLSSTSCGSVDTLAVIDGSFRFFHQSFDTKILSTRSV
jgi:hypothetical protein